MTPTRQERKENIAKLRRQQILDAALAVFSEKGFATATTSEIAKAAGVGEGTIYNYYPSKRELFIAAIKSFIITTPLLNLLEQMPGADFPTTFKSLVKNRLSLIEGDNISRISSLMGEIQRDPQLKALFSEQFLQPFLSQMEGFYSATMAGGKLRKMDPSIITRVVGGLMIGLVILKSMEGETSPLSRQPQDKVAEELMQFVLYGLLGEKTKSSQ